MADTEPRSLHLHTLESLCADLISGGSVALEKNRSFSLTNERARSALAWYRDRGASNWSANVSPVHCEQLVDQILKKPPEVVSVRAAVASHASRRLTLRKLEAHRFAGIHKFGRPGAEPNNYVHDFTADITLFEGRNGSGKTSLVNAIIWALTGEILRPQSEPEAAKEEFECWVSVGGSEKPSLRKLTLVTPLPDAETVARHSNVIPADTWVELTFVDESGATLPPVRRSQSRSSHGRLIETEPDLSKLGLDPIGARIGTVMPGWLPRIRVGAESELGRAVSQLTGLSALGDLADHVRRAKQKIDKDLIRNKEIEKNRCDEAYNVARTDLNKELVSQPGIAPANVVPAPSDDSSIETTLADITRHFEAAKAGAFEAAREILGIGFDAADASSRAKLEKNISPALHELGQLMRLPSLRRLHAWRMLTADELQGTRTKIGELIREARVLENLARAPTEAARIRLYARVASWLAEHPDPRRRDDDCVVCGGSVSDVKDPVTGKLVSVHLHEAAEDAALLSLTLERWAKAAQGELARSLPEALRAELSRELPNHPCDLIRAAFVEELFALDPFLDVLQTLKAGTAAAFDSVAATRTSIAQGIDIALPLSCRELEQALARLDKAIRFALWRQENDRLAREIFGLFRTICGWTEGDQRS